MKEADRIIARFCSPVKTEYGRACPASAWMTGAVDVASDMSLGKPCTGSVLVTSAHPLEVPAFAGVTLPFSSTMVDFVALVMLCFST